MKKLLAVLFTLIMVISAIPLSVYASDLNYFFLERIYGDYVGYKNGNVWMFNYVINKAFVTLKDDFWEDHDTIDASLFPKVSDKIEKIDWVKGHQNIIIYFSGYDVSKKPTDKEIEDFMILLTRLQKVSFIDDIKLAEDWYSEIYDNYTHYKNHEDKFGYYIDGVHAVMSFGFVEEYEEVTAAAFPEIADQIDKISWGKESRNGRIYLKAHDSEGEVTEQDIDNFISILKYFQTNPYVESIDCSQKGDYDIYNNYRICNNYQNTAYGIDAAYISLTDEFCKEHDEVDASFFPEISDKIERVEYFKDFNDCHIFFSDKLDYNPDTPFTEITSRIDSFLPILDYLNTLPFVAEAYPEIYTRIDWDESAENPGIVDPDDTAQTDTTAPDTTAPDTTAPETTAPETTTTEQNKSTSDQTGDNLFFAVSTAFVVCAVLSATVIAKSKKRAAKK